MHHILYARERPCPVRATYLQCENCLNYISSFSLTEQFKITIFQDARMVFTGHEGYRSIKLLEIEILEDLEFVLKLNT